MKRDSDKGGGGAIGLALILLLLIGGAGMYVVARRQQAAAAMQEERSRLAEAQAGLQAAEVREDAEETSATGSIAIEHATSTNPADTVRAAVEFVLRAQEDAWNRGDIDAFAAHYWRSDDVTFSSGGKTTRGWTETLNRYRQRYPTREDMGRVKFSRLEITPLGDAAALVLGEWNLEREGDPLSGNFSLVLRRLDGRWVIIHDHTSRLIE